MFSNQHEIKKMYLLTLNVRETNIMPTKSIHSKQRFFLQENNNLSMFEERTPTKYYLIDFMHSNITDIASHGLSVLDCLHLLVAVELFAK